ncbi:MAG TPA: response regulator [Bryobacteraceae bacterium]|nr:response regulator [Bryobacteraceae bacterium]
MAKTVLIVDDSASMRQMLAFTLQQGGFDVVEGCNGQEGLGQLDGRKVDLILTDLNMPVMDGITFIKNLRTRAELRGTPVLMLTTESHETMKQQGKAAGATGWIVKPFQPDKLLAVIARVLP